MNSGIALYISGLIDTLPFIDKLAGLVTPLNVKENGINKIYPVACGVQHCDCVTGSMNDLVPNSKYKTVIYFEDQGVTFGKVVKDRQYFTSRLRMIAWINLQKLGETGCSLTSDIIVEILRAIPAFPANNGNYLQITLTPVSQPIRNKSIFSQYTYDETINQYLIAPYDYFAIDFNVSWWMNVGCITPYTPSPAITCPKQPSCL